MHLIYLDESGNTGNRRDPDQPFHLLAGLIVHESAIRSIEDAIDNIAARYFWDYWLCDGFELHAAEMFGGKGVYRNYAPETRVEAIHAVVSALTEHGARFIFCAIDKLKNPSSRHPHQMAFQFIVERVEDFLEKETSYGLLVADENKELEQKLIEDLTQYKRTSTGWGYRPTTIRRIVDSVHFVESKNNRLIQCADIIAYFSLRAHRERIRIPTLWAALPEPRPNYQEFQRENTTLAQGAVVKIGEIINPMLISWKLYPQ